MQNFPFSAYLWKYLNLLIQSMQRIHIRRLYFPKENRWNVLDGKGRACWKFKRENYFTQPRFFTLLLLNIRSQQLPLSLIWVFLCYRLSCYPLPLLLLLLFILALPYRELNVLVIKFVLVIYYKIIQGAHGTPPGSRRAVEEQQATKHAVSAATSGEQFWLCT